MMETAEKLYNWQVRGKTSIIFFSGALDIFAAQRKGNIHRVKEITSNEEDLRKAAIQVISKTNIPL